MPSTQQFKSEQEVNEAYSEALRGGVVGASKWGLVAALAGAAAFAVSPVYRGLTVQFKVFLQLSSMTLGGVIEADRRMRAHELVVRHRKRVLKANTDRERIYAQLRTLEKEEEEWEQQERGRRNQ